MPWLTVKRSTIEGKEIKLDFNKNNKRKATLFEMYH